MKKFLFPFLALSFLLFGIAPFSKAQAQGAQPQCNDRPQVLELLAKKYKETPLAAGVTNTGGLVEVLTSKDGTWTIIVSTPQGISCLVAAGEGFRLMQQQEIQDGQES